MLAIALSTWALPTATRGQTCSCAGIPLTGAAQLSAKDARQWHLDVNLAFYDLSDLVAGSQSINDETGRQRETGSLVAQLSYGLSDHWTAGAVASFVEHRRQIAISGEDTQVARGVGDSMLLVSYSPLRMGAFDREQLSFGLGVRVPTGADAEGTPVFIEDMQPSRGAWGASLWTRWDHAFDQRASWIGSVSASFSTTGENDRGYSFEEEWTIDAGLSRALAERWSLGAALGFRVADPHTRFGSRIPNTGGRWLDLSPSIQRSLSRAGAIELVASVPLHRELEGALQFTTRYAARLRFSHQW